MALERIEIELRYYDDINSDSQIIDLVLVDAKILPAWEFRSNFTKSKMRNINGRKQLDLYYTARIQSGSFVCRFEKSAGSKDQMFFMVTEKGKIELMEIPSDLKRKFDRFFEDLATN